jgi:Fic family protein
MNEEYLKDFLSRFTYNTCAIEGSSITLSQTVSITVFGYVQTAAKIREIFKIVNHNNAYKFILDNSSRPIDINFISDLHALLMDRIHHEAGSFKKNDSAILGANFETTKKAFVLQEMKFSTSDMYEELNSAKDVTTICQIIAKYHISFEKIHPFADGNGRIGRLLINKLLIEKNLLPIVILNEEKLKYYSYLADENINELGILIESLIKIENNRQQLFKNSESKL